MLKWFAKTLAVLCALLFILSGLLALVLFNLDQRAFNSQVYERALIEENIYQRLPELIAESIMATSESVPGTPSDQNQAGAPQFIQNLTQIQLEGIITSLIPPEELKQMSEQVLDQIFAYLNGESEQAVLSLVRFKQRLAGEAGVQAILQIMAAQPPCTPDQLIALTAAALTNPADLPLCSLPQESLPLVEPLLQVALRSATKAIPNQVTLIGLRAARSSSLNQVQKDIRLVRLFMRWSPLIPLLCLLGVTILAVRTLKDWLRWWGFPLLFTGGLGLLMVWVSRPLFELVYSRWIANRFPSALPDLISNTLHDLLRAILQGLTRPMAIESLVLTGLGLVLLVTAILVRTSTASPQIAT